MAGPAKAATRGLQGRPKFSKFNDRIYIPLLRFLTSSSCAILDRRAKKREDDQAGVCRGLPAALILYFTLSLSLKMLHRVRKLQNRRSSLSAGKKSLAIPASIGQATTSSLRRCSQSCDIEITHAMNYLSCLQSFAGRSKGIDGNCTSCAASRRTKRVSLSCIRRAYIRTDSAFRGLIIVDHYEYMIAW